MAAARAETLHSYMQRLLGSTETRADPSRRKPKVAVGLSMHRRHKRKAT